MSVQPLPIDRFEFGVAADSRQRLLWRAIAFAERAAAAGILLGALPVLIVVALVIVALSRRSPLIAHRRVGEGGQDIWVLKLRTMWDKPGAWRLAPIVERLVSETLPDVKVRRDPRVTSRFAALCRTYSIDELPQLWQVIRGEMALIGPRPLTAAELDTYYGADALQLLRVKPGLTGLWQIKGRSRLRYTQRRRLDLFMLRKWSLRLYVRILIDTIPSVLAGTDAW